jgi:hypothetical protein
MSPEAQENMRWVVQTIGDAISVAAIGSLFCAALGDGYWSRWCFRSRVAKIVTGAH